MSAADVLGERVSPEQLKGRLVLVGTTAPGLMDLRATPVGAAYPGVEIHANLIAGMLDGKLKHQPGYLVGADVLLLALGGGIMIFLLPRLSPLRASLVALSVLLLQVAVNLVLWHQADLVLPLAGGVIMVALLYAMNMSWGYFVESQIKAAVRPPIRPVRAARTGRRDGPQSGELQHGGARSGADGVVFRHPRFHFDFRGHARRTNWPH